MRKPAKPAPIQSRKGATERKLLEVCNSTVQEPTGLVAVAIFEFQLGEAPKRVRTAFPLWPTLQRLAGSALETGHRFER